MRRYNFSHRTINCIGLHIDDVLVRVGPFGQNCVSLPLGIFFIKHVLMKQYILIIWAVIYSQISLIFLSDIEYFKVIIFDKIY